MRYQPEARRTASIEARPVQRPAPASAPVPPRAEVAWDEAAETLAMVAGKWVLPVLRVLDGSGARRHNELHRAIGARVVSARSLDATLRRMEADGLVERNVDPGTPPAVSYKLTSLAGSLLTPLAALGRWGTAHRRAPRRSDRRTGHEPAA